MTHANRALHERISDLAEADSDADADVQALHILCQPVDWRPDAQKPLMIVVHPGDAIERLCDWPDYESGTEVVQLSVENQVGMADEIQDRLIDHDVIVLHRLSSTYLRESGVEPGYVCALDRCDEQGLVLYSDDLDAVSAWLKENVDGLGELDIDVFMTGAYADVQFGCITTIGKSLLEGNPALNIQVSRWAPTDNSNFSARWSPTPRCAPR